MTCDLRAWKLLWILAVLCPLLLCVASPSLASVATPHLISFQGQALDSESNPIASGDISVRIYDAETGGTLVYDSGSDFAGSVQGGIFDVLLGSITPLNLDNTLPYYLELDINGEEVVGDANGGRQAFYPGGGSHARPDLESRITTLESYLTFTCDPGDYDLNLNPSDQCEFTLDPDGIYVDAVGGSDSPSSGLGPLGTCPTCVPCATINYGIQRAQTLGRSTVYVADGNYYESVILVDGISLKGAYRTDDWSRHLESSSTIIFGSTASGHRKTIVGNAISQTTLVEGFVIFGQSNPEFSGNSYAVWLTDAPGVQLRANQIFAGNGGPGADGSTGLDGESGSSGDDGVDSWDTGTTNCSSGTYLAGGGGGLKTCGPYNANGGNGGDSECPPVFGIRAMSGENGSGVGGGAGGLGGYNYAFEGTLCQTGGKDATGMPGGNGLAGNDGDPGSGAQDPDGTVVSGEWQGAPGGSGSAGLPGSGGGGGGAGGSAEGSSGYDDILGATGGGGGAGGCQGEGGSPGTAGGGSFAVFVASGAAPVIMNNHIRMGVGGAGGRGGPGGRGGEGGAGGTGGTVALDAWCAGVAGDGGNGGRGGNGGGGGGGAGGVAYGIYLGAVSGAPDYCLQNTFVLGSGGAGGSGGASMGNPGSDGLAGSTAACN